MKFTELKLCDSMLKTLRDVLVTSPGRRLELQAQGHIKLDQIDFFVLDEVNRMLDMGFIHDIRRTLQHLPRDRYNLLFPIKIPLHKVTLTRELFRPPRHLKTKPESMTFEEVTQKVLFIAKADKRRLLVHLLDELNIHQCIRFTRAKHGANHTLWKVPIAMHLRQRKKLSTTRQNVIVQLRRQATLKSETIYRDDLRNRVHHLNIISPDDPMKEKL